MLTLLMARKNNFNSPHGPSGADGVIVVEPWAITRWADLERSFAIMDFADPVKDWSREIWVQPVGSELLTKMIEGARLFTPHISYPDSYLTDLERLGERLIAIGPRVLSVEIVDVQPEDVRVETQAVLANDPDAPVPEASREP